LIKRIIFNEPDDQLSAYRHRPMKFAVPEARATKDVDLVLNVLALREQPVSLADTLVKLGYTPVPESTNLQFAKSIPNSNETMRIEFMAREEFKRHNDIRVEQSDPWTISGNLPDANLFTGQIRVTRPHALVMLKLLALADRYNNIRGPKEARHDREEAQTHASDIVAILRVITDIPSFNVAFVSQFQREHTLGIAVLRILADYFREQTSPGLILYAEQTAANLPAERSTTETVAAETHNALQVVLPFMPTPEFLAVLTAIEDSTNYIQGSPLVDEYLSSLEHSRTALYDPLALTMLPAGAFGGAYGPEQHAPQCKRRDFDAERIPTPVVAHVPPNEFGTTPS
jgi:hypothetical protein